MIFKNILTSFSARIFLSIIVTTIHGMHNHPATRGAKRKLAEIEAIKTLTPAQATQKLQIFIKKHRIFPSNPYTLEELKTIISQGADVNTTVNQGTSALMRAAAYGNVEAMQALIEAGAEVNLQRRSARNTALDCTITYERISALKLLIESGADVDAALSFAILRSPNNKIVKLLLDAGADPKKANYLGDSPADIVFRISTHNPHNPKYKQTWQLFTQKYPELALTSEQATQKLQEWMDNSEKLKIFFHTNQTLTDIKKWIAFGADIKNVRSKYLGASALICALRARNSGTSGVINEIVKAGADINAPNGMTKFTALMFAVANKDLYATEWLLKNGADPKIPMQSGKTAIDMANTGDVQQIKDLINRYSKLKI